jgi:hypothetical protein
MKLLSMKLDRELTCLKIPPSRWTNGTDQGNRLQDPGLKRVTMDIDDVANCRLVVRRETAATIPAAPDALTCDGRRFRRGAISRSAVREYPRE